MKTGKKIKIPKQLLANSFWIIPLVLINLFVCNVCFVFGDSMNNTLKNGNVVLVEKLSEIRQGDIVVTDSRNSLKTVLIKRVIAIGGQHIVIDENGVFIDGEQLHEPYVPVELSYGSYVDVIVPQNSFFLMGDNRNASKDSRDIGCIPKEQIKGKVFFGIIPFGAF